MDNLPIVEGLTQLTHLDYPSFQQAAKNRYGRHCITSKDTTKEVFYIFDLEDRQWYEVTSIHFSSQMGCEVIECLYWTPELGLCKTEKHLLGIIGKWSRYIIYKEDYYVSVRFSTFFLRKAFRLRNTMLFQTEGNLYGHPNFTWFEVCGIRFYIKDVAQISSEISELVYIHLEHYGIRSPIRSGLLRGYVCGKL